jgi:hypothetical protein
MKFVINLKILAMSRKSENKLINGSHCCLAVGPAG